VAAGAPGAPDMVVPTHRSRPIRARSGRGPRSRRSAEPAPRGRSRLRLSNWRVRTKLIAALLIPTLAFLVVAGAQVSSLVAASMAAAGFASEVELAPRISALVDRLQDERDRTAGELAAFSATGVSSADEARINKVLAPYHAATDREIDSFTAQLRRLPPRDVTWATARAQTERALEAIGGLRDLSVVSALPTRATFDTYRWTIETLIDLMEQAAEEAVDGSAAPATAARITAAVELARAKEVMSQLRGRLLGAARAGTFGPSDLVDLADLRSERGTALADFRAAATAEQNRRFDAMAATAAFRRANELADQAVSRAGGTEVGLDPGQWWTAAVGQQEQLRTLQAGLLDEAVSAARTYRDGQLRRTLVATGAIGAVLLIALLTSYAIGRSTHRSLRLLRGQALQVAHQQLPEVIQRLRALKPAERPDIESPSTSIRGMDEIGEVGEAFAAVHRSAVELAVEQAVMRRNVNAMFVNLARRSQVLVERQLELLDGLEREESDPDQLEHLFKLDHLAARMRRNDENLLVLAGSESIRRWSEPVELPAVTLAAIAEIEQYPRVRHDVTDHIYVVGHVVSDLVHLLAELVENATTFSPPGSSVLVTGGPHTQDGGLIQIIDRGMGMTATALAEANELLAAPPAADVAASERMGLFVVSHLAARHGVRVQLSVGERGLVASVWLPTTLLAAPPIRALPDSRGARPMIAAVAAGAALSGAARPAAERAAGAHAAAGWGELESGTAAREPIRPGRSALRRPGRRGALTRSAGGSQAGPGLTPATGPTTNDAAPAGCGASADGIWFGRPADAAGRQPVARSGVAAQPLPAAGSAPGRGLEPATGPVVAGRSASGLPVRVPMAQLPGAQQAVRGRPEQPATPNGPGPRDEPEPDAVGSTLSRFYAGVRRAEAEDIHTSAAPAGPRIEEEQP
jgi:signal transduction histidine kinase